MNSIVNFRLCKLSDAELLNKVDEMTDQMFHNMELPPRNIPARPNEDYDLLVGELVVRFHEKNIKPVDGDLIDSPIEDCKIK